MKSRINLLQKLGFFLILVSFLLLLGAEIYADFNRTATRKLTEQIQSYLPERTEGDPQDYSDAQMPVLQLQGEEFSGLLEIPDYGVALPVGSSWEREDLSRYPCRFWGSVYDSSLIIGGTGKKGQLDICSRMDLDDKIRITDMTGTQFCYEVVGIDRRNHADMQIFREKQSDLILFVRDEISMDYILVRCILAPGYYP